MVERQQLQGRRVESPSSINMYKQCPRKYYYRYVERLPTGTSIHLIRGNVAHKVLEDFYDLALEEDRTRNFRFLHLRLLKLFTVQWKRSKDELEGLGMDDQELQGYFDETVMMLQNWFNRFKKRMQARMANGEEFHEAFRNLTPKREAEYRSEEFMVRGYIDYIHEVDGNTLVMDYKTSKRDHISDEYKLQLAIYALLYEEKHGVKPDYVGIDFLKSIEKMLPVDDELLQHARFELEQIHASTGSDHLEDYPMRPSPLCKWRTGQCDYYDLCFGGKTVEEYRAEHKK
ncbi:MAG: RecB family exonuclease [Candidatus Woesearchaeota archaeon]